MGLQWEGYQGTTAEARARFWQHPQPFPTGTGFCSTNKDKAQLCGVQAARGQAAFPLYVTSPPLNQPPDSLKSGWVGGTVKPQPLNRL